MQVLLFTHGVSPVLGLATTGRDYAVRAPAVTVAEAAIADGGGTYWYISKIVGGAEEPMHLSAGPRRSAAGLSGDKKPLCLSAVLRWYLRHRAAAAQLIGLAESWMFSRGQIHLS